MTGRVVSPSVLVVEELIDHAPTYPPEQLQPSEAVRAHRLAQRSIARRCCARLVWSADALGALGALLGPDEQVRLSLVVAPPEHPADAVAAVESALGAAASDPRFVVDQLEIGLRPTVVEPGTSGSRAVLASVAEVMGSTPLFVERTVGEASVAVASELAAVGFGLKLRCGSVRPDGAPTPSALAASIHAAHEADIPWKATAGLHRALARVESDRVGHGVINLLSAAALARGLTVDDLALILAAPDLGLTAEGWVVAGRPIAVDELIAARRLFRSIGSCSFDEPIDDLIAVGALHEEDL